MKKAVFSILVVVAIVWATTAGALHRSSPEPLTAERGDGGWSIAETGAAPGWSITPAHARMW